MEERLHALETENTNLRRAWHEAESRLAYLTDLYEHAPVACLRLDRDGAIRDANHAVAMLLGVPKAALLHLSLYRFLTVEIQQQLRQWLADVMRSGLSQSNEFAFQTSTRHALHLLVEASSDRNRQTCRLSLIDISARKRAERRIADNEERLRLMSDFAPVLIWIAGPDGQYRWFNKMWLDFTGRTLEQEIGCGWVSGVHPDDVTACLDIQARAFEERAGFTMEFRLRDAGGSYHYMLAKGVSRTSPSGRYLGYIGSCTDISERKKAEEALRHSRQMLRHLVSYQERVREDERKRIAREIHDDLGQNLLALRIDVALLHARTGLTHPRLHARVGAALSHIDETMKAVRAAINNLRPAVLDLGLKAAIEWQVQDFQRRSSIACNVALEDVSLDDNRATALFRILQESLNNVLRHAQASEVTIELHRRNDTLAMEISDNGVGIYPDCRRKANSFGLVGIEERLSTFGGTLSIRNDSGTSLTIVLPLEPR